MAVPLLVLVETSASAPNVTVQDAAPLRVTIGAGVGPQGPAGGGGASWLTDGLLDVDAGYRYITGFTADGHWQVNRRDRTTKILTVAKATNNPTYTFTTQAQLRADRGTLIYA